MDNKKSNKNVKDLRELKEKTIEYYKQNGVPKKMEEILNAMIFEDPDDVFGHIANYFESLAKVPSISKVVSYEVFDAKGFPTVCVEIWYTVKNQQQRLASFVGCTESYPTDVMRVEEVEAADADKRTSVTAAVELIMGDLGREICGLASYEQRKLDNRISSCLERLQAEAAAERTAREAQQLEELSSQSVADKLPQVATPVSKAGGKGQRKSSPGQKKGKSSASLSVSPEEAREQFFPGCNALSTLSQAFCIAGAKSNNIPLYQYIASLLVSNEDSCKFSVPLPMVTMLYAGKASTGKLKCIKEVMIMPGPLKTVKEFMKHLPKLFAHCLKGPSGKGASLQKLTVNEQGCINMALDRPEQALDLLQEAITQVGLQPGEDITVALNCAAHQLFDMDKGKYEIAIGALKTAEELVEFWADIITRYPIITAIIDPLRKQDAESWMKLCERVSQNCLVIGDSVYHRPGVLKSETLSPTFKTSAIVLRAEHMNTVSDLLDVASKMNEADIQLVLATSLNDVPESFLVDLAVGLAARFIKIGGSTRGEKVMKLSRLLQIEQDLDASNSLMEPRPHHFPFIRPLTPVVLGAEDGEAGQTDGLLDTNRSQTLTDTQRSTE